MDKEKVIKALNQHCNGSMFDRCGKCPYYYYKIIHEPFECRDELLEDVFTLLKEQEPVEPIIMDHTVFGTNRKCSKCGRALFPAGKYCPHCGKPVKWNE